MEDCDDGNEVNTDACLNDCDDAGCGDGVVHEGVEACDDGNGEDNDACTNACVANELGSAARPAQNCRSILAERPQTESGLYWVDPNGGNGDDAFEIHCDMDDAEGGWGLVYIMCQDGGGDARADGLSHDTPIRPVSNQPVTSLPYDTVAAMEPQRVRFASDFGERPGYLFSWEAAIADVNHVQLLLDGTQRDGTANRCYQIGTPLNGSSGPNCSMIWEHNNGGGEVYDIPTFGCSCHVW